MIAELKKIPGIVDLHKLQENNAPEIFINVDRKVAKDLGFSMLDISNALQTAISGSFQMDANFWVDPKNQVSYPLLVQVPQYQLNSLEALRNIEISSMENDKPVQLLGALANLELRHSPNVASSYNIEPSIDIFAGIAGRDFASVHRDMSEVIKKLTPQLPRGSEILQRGQLSLQSEVYYKLFCGLIFSIILIYLLLVVNFQSWLDPLIIISVLPAALTGVIWVFFLTATPLSVPAMIGVVMSLGVVTANSVLVVNFAKILFSQGEGSLKSALGASVSRLRPVIITATAVIIGALPMALGLGEGDEQIAPLGRAVIGGVSLGTLATLFFVPIIFHLIYSKKPSFKEVK
jgi:multidrug efflux pump subunit AcrB